ncbi:MAG: LamG domain-containing protein [Planctomycetales bacterium]|nr:LamG domain-containing protein [Planctomycetales bacterium]
MNRTTILSLIAATCLSASAVNADLSDGLELYYTFDNDTLASGGIADSSGNGRNGSPVDDDASGAIGLMFSSDVPAQLGSGNSLDLRGITDYLVADSYTGIAGGADRTIALWVKSASVANQHMVEWGTNDAGNRYTFRINNSEANGTLGGIRNEIQTTFVINDIPVSDGEWHHVAVAFDVNDGAPSKNDINLYVDGVLAGATTTNANDPVLDTIPLNPVAIGGTNVFTDRSVDGLMDDVAIWSRALEASEIASLASGAAIIPEPNSAVLILFGCIGFGLLRRTER